MIQCAICEFETEKRKVIYLLREISDSMKKWPLPCIRLKFIGILGAFERLMNTWTYQTGARKSKILELLKHKIIAKIALQTGNTNGRVEVINNLYANGPSDPDENYKDEFGFLIANLHPMLYTIGLS